MHEIAMQRSRLVTYFSLDSLFTFLTKVLASSILALVVAILIALLVSSVPALRAFGLNFLISTQWDPVLAKFGAVSPIAGTLTTAVIAMLIGIPLSFGIAVFISEMAPRRLKRPIGVTIELMGGIPSIIYGMWGLFVLAPLMRHVIQPTLADTLGKVPFLSQAFQGPIMGIGLLTAGFILAIMVIPLIASVMSDLFSTVPRVIKEAAYSAGATRFEVITRVLIPYTRVGLVGSVILGFGRALGETMAVTFVIGNAHQLSRSLFAPGTSIASVIANEFAEATGTLYPSALLELGLILFIITFLVLTIARLLLNRYKRR